jgi:Flp pilus assembly protein protease CpaA
MLTALVLVVISYIDIKSRRIPNVWVLGLLIITICEGDVKFDFGFFLVSSLCIAAFTAISGCGFGDTKLALVIANILIGRYLIGEYLLYVFAISSLSIALHVIHHRGIKGDIAFAPALCGAVLGVRILSPL